VTHQKNQPHPNLERLENYFLHIFVYILSAEPVQTDSTRSSLKPAFFCPTLLFSRRLSVKKKTGKKIPTARLPHVRRTCGCAVNLPHNRTCGAASLDRGEKTREGAKSVVGLLERMKRGRGIKDLDDKSHRMEILMTEAFTKINPTDPLILDKQTARRKRKGPDSSGMSLDRSDVSR
jgi:hypothetical protein